MANSAGKFVRAILTGSAPVTDLVSTRIHPVMLPQNAAYPAIVYVLSGTPADQYKGNPGTTESISVQLNMWAEEYDELDTIFDAVRDALDFQPGTAGSQEVTGIHLVEWRDGMDEEGEFFMRQATYQMRLKRV